MNDRDSSKIVENFLSNFTDERDQQNDSGMIEKTSLGVMDIDLTNMNDRDMAAITSVFISLIASMAGSTYTGYARAAYYDMLPHIGQELVDKGETNITSKHVDFVKDLLRTPVSHIIKEENKLSPVDLRLPVQLGSLVEEIALFGIAMHMAGKNGIALDIKAGFAHTINSLVLEILKSAGVRTGMGSIDDNVRDVVVTKLAPLDDQHRAGKFQMPEDL